MFAENNYSNALNAAADAGDLAAWGNTWNNGVFLTSAQQVGKVLAHGFAGGVIAKINGMKFGHGFMSASVTQAFAKSINNVSTNTKKVFAAALIGGITSSLTESYSLLI